MVIDYKKIAEKYAADIGKEIVREAGLINGFYYFYIDYKVRPRYLGPPHIIKINPFGKVIEVWDTKEINEACNRIRTAE